MIKQVAERNHAMRTAMLATCEAQLETHAADLQAKDNTIAGEYFVYLCVYVERSSAVSGRIFSVLWNHIPERPSL